MVVVALVCAGLTTLPLVGSLGYENGFILAPIFSVLAVSIGVDGVRRVRADTGPSNSHPVLGTLRELGLLHALAVGILLAGQLWQRGCDPLGGLLFYLMGPLASSVLGWVCGLWGGVLTTRRLAQLGLGLVPFFVSVAVGLWRLFADPVVFAYDPFFGFFSGSIYDESIAVDRRYLWYRAYNALALMAALGSWALLVEPGRLRIARPGPSRRTGILASVSLLGWFATGTVAVRATEYRFTADAGSITRVLSGTFETEHFVIHYVPRTADARAIEDLAAEHEFAWARLESIMGRAPDRKVHSFVFANPDQKRALMGAGRVQVAAPWRYQIYLDHRGYPHPVLHHELAHVFGATIGDPLLGVARDGLSINIGLIEGLATALAPRASDRLDLHDQAKVLGELDRRPAMASIMGPGFFAQSSRVAYITAGSFVKWLIDTRGFEPMAVLYRTAGDFEQAYGQSVQTLEGQWLEFLAGYEGITEADVQAQAQRFKRTSVWERPCAHKVAEVRAEVGRAVSQGRLQDAVEARRELCRLEPENPSHKLALAEQLAHAGAYAEARAVLDETDAVDDLTVTLRSIAFERRGDVELSAGRLDAAATAYAAALDLPDSEDRRRILQLKQTAATDPALAPIITAYLALFDTDGDGITQAVSRIHHAVQIERLAEHRALGSYLWGLQLVHIQQPEQAVPLLEAALQRGGEGLPSPEFIRAARESLMTVYLQTHQWDRAREILADARAVPSLGNGHLAEYDLWEQRIDFYERYFDSAPG